MNLLKNKFYCLIKSLLNLKKNILILKMLFNIGKKKHFNIKKRLNRGKNYEISKKKCF